MTAKKETNDNMELWNKVCETNPAITKHVNQRGGFDSPCAQTQIKRATELWGPYGEKWGCKDLAWGIIDDGNGEPIGMTLDLKFFSPVCNFEISTDMLYKPNDDCRKKLLTDVTTKALSKIGFNSDIFEGKFDDNKYVQEMREKHNGNKESATPPPESKPVKQATNHYEVFGAAMKEKAKLEEFDLAVFNPAQKKNILKGMVAFLAKGASPLYQPYSENMPPENEGWAELAKVLSDPLSKWQLTDKCVEFANAGKESE